MNITFIMIILGVIGATLNTVILLGSIFKPKKLAKSDADSQSKKSTITVTIESDKGKEKLNVNESDPDKVIRKIQACLN